jgi:hypothetical protein
VRPAGVGPGAEAPRGRAVSAVVAQMDPLAGLVLPATCENRVRPRGTHLPFVPCGEIATSDVIVHCTNHDGTLSLPLCGPCLERLKAGGTCRKCKTRTVVLVAIVPTTEGASS